MIGGGNNGTVKIKRLGTMVDETFTKSKEMYLFAINKQPFADVLQNYCSKKFKENNSAEVSFLNNESLAFCEFC